MNKYPYNAGHLMVVPIRHKGELVALTASESNEFFELTRKSVTVLKKAMPVDGFNIGLNLGADAGAGIRDHIHIHIVPRFKGDTNFISVLSDVKLQSISLLEIYDMLRPGFDKLKGRS
jgi:ATP adenylyltransferase